MFKSLLLHTPKFKTPLYDGITQLKFNYLHTGWQKKHLKEALKHFKECNFPVEC